MECELPEELKLEFEREDSMGTSRVLRKQTHQPKMVCPKEERNASLKKVASILMKSEHERTKDECEMLRDCSEAVEEVQQRWKKRDEAKRRLEEFEEPKEKLEEKCLLLAQAIAQSQHLVVYTGAGISTAARIPDYRGTNGIWTRLQQGKDIGNHDLSLAEPTYTHMALAELFRKKILKYVVSQNCDGLHLRSGLPRSALSELHGNMFIEVCKSCKPVREYLRQFDVTENTARYSHKTMRKCYYCNNPLQDTIVHFGERGRLAWPLNWQGACRNAKAATTILCLGSSLKVLKKYPWLWQMDKPAKKRPNLYIVNLQWTPKDDVANAKINGKCDEVMKIVMQLLGIEVSEYSRDNDPLFAHATSLCAEELHTTTQPLLKGPECKQEFIEDPVTSQVKIERFEENIDTSNANSSTKTVQKDCDLDKSSAKLEPQNCDIIHNGLPEHSKRPKKFLIDDIISQPNLISNSEQIFQNNTSDIVHNNFLLNQAFLNYYQFINSQLLRQDLIYYPIQTGFLYPGLHSIINPIPFFDLPTSQSIKKEENVEEVKPDCVFCKKKYDSNSCLFYKSLEEKFVKQQYRFSKSENKSKPVYCVCCDCSSDEDEDSDTQTKNEGSDAETSSDCKIFKSDECSVEQGKVNKIQAGWFGKGYRKNKRNKKR